VAGFAYAFAVYVEYRPTKRAAHVLERGEFAKEPAVKLICRPSLVGWLRCDTSQKMRCNRPIRDCERLLFEEAECLPKSE
jgi:hypothetical protein